MSAPTIEEMAEAVGHARQMLHHAKELLCVRGG